MGNRIAIGWLDAASTPLVRMCQERRELQLSGALELAREVNVNDPSGFTYNYLYVKLAGGALSSDEFRGLISTEGWDGSVSQVLCTRDKTGFLFVSTQRVIGQAFMNVVMAAFANLRCVTKFSEYGGHEDFMKRV